MAALDRARLIRILGKLGSSVAVKPLVGLLQARSGPNVHLLRNVIGALTKIGTASSLHAVIESLEHDQVYVRSVAYQTLRRNTGKMVDFDPFLPDKKTITVFQEWWEQKFGKSWTEG